MVWKHFMNTVAVQDTTFFRSKSVGKSSVRYVSLLGCLRKSSRSLGTCLTQWMEKKATTFHLRKLRKKTNQLSQNNQEENLCLLHQVSNMLTTLYLCCNVRSATSGDCLLYSKWKLSAQDKAEIKSVNDDTSYTCGTTLQELNLPDKILCVYVREHNCFDPVRKLYYSAGFEPICIYVLCCCGCGRLRWFLS